jgi:spore maturation protein CgeB
LNDVRGYGQNNRVDYLDRLFKAFPNSWLSTNVFFEQMAQRFVKARMGFNISIQNDLNMRTFEVMSTGVPLLTNRNVEGIDGLFTENYDYIGYEGPDEMIHAAKYCMTLAPLESIAKNAFKKVRGKHTYKHRMKEIVEGLKNV